MKKIVFVLLAFVFCTSFGQKVNKKTGDITVDGTKVGRIKKEGGMVKSYILYDVDDHEIATFEPQVDEEDPFYIVFFSKTNHKGKCSMNISFSKKIAKAFVKSSLVKDGTYLKEKEARFMSAFLGGKYFGGKILDAEDKSPKILKKNTVDQEFVLVKRDRQEGIDIEENKIVQDFKTIAYFDKKEKAKDGEILEIIKIFNHNKVLIAEAISEDFMGDTYKITTIKDHKVHKVTCDDIEEVNDIIVFLIKKYYL